MKLTYKGFDSVGNPVSGRVDASTPEDATAALRKNGLFVTEILPADHSPTPTQAPGPVFGGGRKITRKQIANFSRELAVLINTGTPVVEALASLECQAPPGRWHSVIADIRKRVEEGQQLSEAMAQHADVFDGIFRSLVAAGESGGRLDVMMERLASLTRQQVRVENTVRGAMLYPALLIAVSIVVLGAMVGFVLPRFEGLFQTLGAPLPPLTKFMLAIGGIVREWWYLLIGGAVILGVGAKLALARESTLAAIDTLLVTVPALSKITRSFAVARVSRVLGVLLEGRVPMLESLGLTRQATGNRSYAKMIAAAEDAVTKGETLSGSFTASGLVPHSVCEAIRNAEKGGRLATVLLSLADFLDEDNEVAVKALVGLIEPVILIGMGLLVGVVAISLFLPLFDLSAAGGGP